MALDFDNLVIDRPLRVRMQDKTTGELMYMVDQIKEATLTNGANQVYITGAAGVRLATLNRDKTTSFSFQNGLVSMSMLSTQTGSDRELASDTKKIKTPAFEIKKVGANDGVVNTTIKLDHVPVGIAGKEIPFIYILQKDSSLGVKFAIGPTATENEFALDPVSKTITLPTSALINENSQIAIDYNYDATSAIKVVNRGDVYGKSGRVIVELLLRDICDNNKKYYSQFIMPNATASGAFEFAFGSEGVVHGWSCEANQDICSEDKELFSWIVPDAA